MRLYRSFANRACSSDKAYLATMPGVASGILMLANIASGKIRAHFVATKAYFARPIFLITHSFPLGALSRIS